MIAVNIITGLCALGLIWFSWMTWKEDHRKDEPDQWEEEIKDVVKVEDIDIGHAIYDMFPEWGEEFKDNPIMDENAAVCDMYLVLKEIQKAGKLNVKLAVMISDTIERFEKYAL